MLGSPSNFLATCGGKSLHFETNSTFLCKLPARNTTISKSVGKLKDNRAMFFKLIHFVLYDFIQFLCAALIQWFKVLKLRKS